MAPDSTALTGGGASAILDQLQTKKSFVVEAGEIELKAGLQPLDLTLRDGDYFLRPGTYQIVLVTGEDGDAHVYETTARLIVNPAEERSN